MMNYSEYPKINRPLGPDVRGEAGPGPAVYQKAPGVLEQLDQTHKELESLYIAINHLNERLTPVMRQMNTMETVSENSTTAVDHSTISSGIVDIRTKVVRLRNIITSTINALDI